MFPLPLDFVGGTTSSVTSSMYAPSTASMSPQIVAAFVSSVAPPPCSQFSKAPNVSVATMRRFYLAGAVADRANRIWPRVSRPLIAQIKLHPALGAGCRNFPR